MDEKEENVKLYVKNDFYSIETSLKKEPQHIINLKNLYSECYEKKRNYDTQCEVEGLLRILYNENNVKNDMIEFKFFFKNFTNFEITEIFKIEVNTSTQWNCNNLNELIICINNIKSEECIKITSLGKLNGSCINIPTRINTNKTQRKYYTTFLLLITENQCYICQPYTCICPKQFFQTSSSRPNCFLKNLYKNDNYDWLFYYFNIIFKNESECKLKSKFNYNIKLYKIEKMLLLKNTSNIYNEPLIIIQNIKTVFENYYENMMREIITNSVESNNINCDNTVNHNNNNVFLTEDLHLNNYDNTISQEIENQYNREISEFIFTNMVVNPYIYYSNITNNDIIFQYIYLNYYNLFEYFYCNRVLPQMYPSMFL